MSRKLHWRNSGRDSSPTRRPSEPPKRFFYSAKIARDYFWKLLGPGNPRFGTGLAAKKIGGIQFGHLGVPGYSCPRRDSVTSIVGAP